VRTLSALTRISCSTCDHPLHFVDIMMLLPHQVQDILADVLRRAGTASSRYAARLFRPVQQQQQQGPAGSAENGGSSLPAAAVAAGTHPANSGKDITSSSSSSSAAAAAAGDGTGKAAATTASGYWYSSSASLNLNKLGTAASMQLYEPGDAAALVAAADNDIDDATWLALIQRNSDPSPDPNPNAYKCPMPQLQVSSLRPQLALAAQLLAAAAVEPQWARGFGVVGSSNARLWFDAAAWDGVIKVLLLLLTR
jgi:hypothetical protein